VASFSDAELVPSRILKMNSGSVADIIPTPEVATDVIAGRICVRPFSDAGTKAAENPSAHVILIQNGIAGRRRHVARMRALQSRGPIVVFGPSDDAFGSVTAREC
jgi:hypothetical protein